MKKEATQHEVSPRGPGPGGRLRALVVATLVVALLGLALAIELTRVHYLTHTDPAYSALCAVSERVNCETVALSPYSVFLGVPVSVWGLLAYAVVAVLCVWALSKRRLHDLWPVGGLFVLGLCAFAASAFLAFVSFTKIDAICLYCNGLYALDTVWLGLAIALVRKAGVGPVRAVALDLGAALHHPAATAALAVPAVVAALLLVMVFPRYWEAGLSTDLGGLPVGKTERGEHWIGARTPTVTIVEYTDYECPFCRRAHRELRRRLPAMADRVRVVHKHFPLDRSCNPMIRREFHRRACELSTFVECAGRQGKFWEANDAVFASLEGRRAAVVDLGKIMARLGLDAPKIKTCMRDEEARRAVGRDIEDGIARRVTGTPTYFVGDRRHEGMLSAEKLEAMLAAACGGAPQESASPPPASAPASPPPPVPASPGPASPPPPVPASPGPASPPPPPAFPAGKAASPPTQGNAPSGQPR